MALHTLNRIEAGLTVSHGLGGAGIALPNVRPRLVFAASTPPRPLLCLDYFPSQLVFRRTVLARNDSANRSTTLAGCRITSTTKANHFATYSPRLNSDGPETV